MEHKSDKQLIGFYLKTLQLEKLDRDYKKMLEMELMKRDPLFEALDRSNDIIGNQVGTDG